MSIVKFELNETQLALQLRSTLEQADSCYTKLSLKAADVSGDGVIDSSDAVLILQYAAGALKEFPAAAPKETEDTGSTDQIAAGDTGLPKE